MSLDQILTADQMRAAEQALFDQGTSVEELMEIAAGGAAEWIRRIAAGRAVTVLCGPGNNGGDGYVIARRLREAGNPVHVIAPVEPKTDAAKNARKAWAGPVSTSGAGKDGEIFVDCLFGSGLTRPLTGEHALLLRDLAERHRQSIAIDVPSGIESDTGRCLNDRLPQFDVTLALGAWKFAHWSLPGRALMGATRLVPIGVAPVAGAARLVQRPSLNAPLLDDHKYSRGLAMIIGGEMPGATRLSAAAAMRGGAGYVKLLTDNQIAADDPALVIVSGSPSEALVDERIDAVLIGPGLGRSHGSRERAASALANAERVVLDADALVLLKPEMLKEGVQALATPHDGELDALCRAFSVIAEGRRNKAAALAKVSGMVVMAKGPDTVIAAPDGRIAIAPPATSWLSVAGTGDVLAGIAVSRMASGSEPFLAACEASWLHGEAARLCQAPFGPLELAHSIPDAFAQCL